MTLIDRYLFYRYWYVFLVGYVALFGLYFVIDVFTNVGDFLDLPGGVVSILSEVFRYYSFRSCAFFGAIGGTMEVIAGIATLALMQKNGELYPVLSAGISTFRMLRAIFVGAVLANALIVLNQELVIPRIALELQQNAGSRSEVSSKVEPAIDFSADIAIAGTRLNLRKRSIEGAEFVLRETRVVSNLTPLLAREAVSVEGGNGNEAGWLLFGVRPSFEELPLSDLGKQLIRRGEEPDSIFIRTDVTFDQLYNRDSSFEYLSTWDLIQRVQNPSFSRRSIRSQSLFLHARLTKPILNLIVLFVGVPFIARKESTSLLKNVGFCSMILGVMFGTNEVFNYLAKVNLISGESAVWLPILFWGSAAAWFSGAVKT